MAAPDSTLLSLITGSGVCGVFVVLFLLGFLYPKSVVEDLRAERDALRQAVRDEQERAEVAVAAAQASRDVFAALQAGMTLAQQPRNGGPYPKAAPGGSRQRRHNEPGGGAR